MFRINICFGFLFVTLIPCNLVCANSGGAAKMFEFFAGYLGGKALDRLFDSDPTDRVIELGNRLRALEDSLSVSSSNVRQEIAQLRYQLNERTSKEAFERAIRSAMDNLRNEAESVLSEIERKGDVVLERLNAEVLRIEGRTTDLERRQANLDYRFKQYERNFGEVPKSVPQPYRLLEAPTSGQSIRAHPKLVPFLRLMVESEVSRYRIETLSDFFADTSSEVADALKADDGLCQKAKAFHREVCKEIEDSRRKERELLQRFKESHHEIRDLRDKRLALEWIQVASKPVSYRGKERLGVSKLFQGDGCSKIILAFTESGGNATEFEPLLRIQFTKDVADRLFQISPTEVPNFPKGYESHVQRIWNKYAEIARELQTTSMMARTIDRSLSRISQSSLPSNSMHLTMMRSRKELLGQLEKLEQRANQELERAICGYCVLLTEYLPSSREMQSLKDFLIVPLMNCKEMLACQSWSSPSEASTIWKRIVESAPIIAQTSTLPVYREIRSEIIAVNEGFEDRSLFIRGYPSIERNFARSSGHNTRIRSSRLGSYRFSFSDNRKSINFFAGQGQSREQLKEEGKLVVFERLDFDSPLRYFCAGSPLAVAMTDNGKVMLLDSCRQKSWPMHRSQSEIPSNVDTTVAGSSLYYSGWQVTNSVRLKETPKCVAHIDELFFAILKTEESPPSPNQSFVTLHRWEGGEQGKIWLPPGASVDLIVRDGKKLVALNQKGAIECAWDIELLARVQPLP